MDLKRLFTTVGVGFGLGLCPGTVAGPGLGLRVPGAHATDLYGGGSDLAPDLRNMLASSDAERRRRGIEMMESLEPRLVVPHLMQRLRDEDAGVRARAARALGPMAGPLLDAAPQLIEGLSDIDGGVRAACAEALGQAGALPHELLGPATAALGRAMGDAQFEVRLEVVRATARLLRARALGAADLGALLGPLLLRAEDENVGVRRAAVVALGRAGQLSPGKDGVARIVVALLGRLSDAARDVRSEALGSLAGLGAPSPGVERAALRLLRDPTDEVKKQAVLCLGRLGVASAVPTLIELLDLDAGASPGSLGSRTRTPDALRAAALQGLGLFVRASQGGGADSPAQKAAPAALAALVQSLDVEDLRPGAREALLAVGAGAADALVERLAGGRKAGPPDQVEIAAAVDLLRDLAAQEGKRLPGGLRERIAAALREELLRVRLPREQVLDALGATFAAGSGGVAPVLTGLLTDRDALVRARALAALRQGLQGGAGEKLLDARALDAVLAVSRDRERGLRADAARLLGQLRARAAAPRLVELLQDAEPTVRAAAAEALGTLALAVPPLDDRAVAALVGVVTAYREGAGEQRTRRAAAQALGQAADADAAIAQTAMPPLLVALKSRGKASDGARAEILAALGAVLRGRPSETARDALLDLALSGAEANTPESALALDALDALAATRDPQLGGKLTRLLEHGPRDALRRVRAVAAMGSVLPGLGGGAADSAVAALVRTLAEDVDVRVAAEAAWALGHVPAGAPAAVKRATAGLRQVFGRRIPASMDGGVRANTLGALALLGQAEPGDAEWLGDSDPGVRANAALLVGVLGRPGGGGLSPGMRARLRHVALADDDARVRRNADRALSGTLPGAGEAPVHFLGLYQLDYDRRPLAESRFRMTRPDGLVRVAVTDTRGIAREERLPAGTCDIEPLEEGMIAR